MVVLLVVAGRTVADCELVCALATERPIPVTTINANGLSSLVEGQLLITFRFIALHPDDRKGPAQWPVPPLALAFGNNWGRRRGFALAVVPTSLRIARSDAEESQRRCSQ
jgi:hypothetical protein